MKLIKFRKEEVKVFELTKKTSKSLTVDLGRM